LLLAPALTEALEGPVWWWWLKSRSRVGESRRGRITRLTTTGLGRDGADG
jgi:hypothetical protein